MKTQTSFIVTGILCLVFLLSVSSATLVIKPTPLLAQEGTSFTFDVENTGNDSVDVSFSADTISDTIYFTSSSFSDLENGTMETLTMDYETNDFNFKFGETYSTSLFVYETGNMENNATRTITFEDTPFCDVGNPNSNIEMEIDRIKVIAGYGDDDDYWYPQDEIEITIEVSNEGDDDIDNIEVEWALYTSDGKRILDDELSDFDLKDGDSEDLTFTFFLDAEELDEDEEDYVLYIKATGEDLDNNDESICDSDSQSIRVNIDRDFVIVSDISVPEEIFCGEEFTISGRVWNIGSRDQDEVSLDIFNSPLGIDETIDLGTIDVFEDKEFSISIVADKQANTKSYPIEFSVYDDDRNIFENDEDDKATTNKVVKYSGECSLPQENVFVSATLEGNAVAGSDTLVKVDVTNFGDETATYTLSVVGYGAWADSASLSKTSLAIAAGAFDSSEITFKVKEDVSGTQNFEVKVLYEGKVVLTQPVALEISEDEGTSWSFSEILGDNWHLWLIGIANVVLILVIIFVAIKIAKS
jgi:archaellum component FlaG (FlaF/FlaG flagellin family)